MGHLVCIWDNYVPLYRAISILYDKKITDNQLVIITDLN